jgi:hypothetical protein
MDVSLLTTWNAAADANAYRNGIPIELEYGSHSDDDAFIATGMGSRLDPIDYRRGGGFQMQTLAPHINTSVLQAYKFNCYIN